MKEPMEPATSIAMAFFIVEMAFSTAAWLVRNRLDSTWEPNTQDQN